MIVTLQTPNGSGRWTKCAPSSRAARRWTPVSTGAGFHGGRPGVGVRVRAPGAGAVGLRGAPASESDKGLVRRYLAKVTGLSRAPPADRPASRDRAHRGPARWRSGVPLRAALHAGRHLEGLIEAFPFVVQGIHADNASRRDAPARSTSTTASPPPADSLPGQACSTSCTSGSSPNRAPATATTTPSSRATTPAWCATTSATATSRAASPLWSTSSHSTCSRPSSTPTAPACSPSTPPTPRAASPSATTTAT